MNAIAKARAALITAVITASAVIALSPSAIASTEHCDLGGKAHRSGILVYGQCVLAGDGTPSQSAATPQTKTIFCGRASQEKDGPLTSWDARCGAPQQCYRHDPKTTQPVLTDAFATLTRTNTGGWSRPVVWCPADPAPAVTLAAIRQQAVRLLPHVGIGIAPPDAVTLVHIQTVLWADTPVDRALPAATLVGHQVRLRVHLAQARWDFGDGHTDTTSSPGAPYDPQHPCRTAQCPGYYGHTYTATGQLTITLTMTWRAEYSLDAGNTWLAVDPAPLTGPTATQPIHIRQARGVLVPD